MSAMPGWFFFSHSLRRIEYATASTKHETLPMHLAVVVALPSCGPLSYLSTLAAHGHLTVEASTMLGGESLIRI